MSVRPRGASFMVDVKVAAEANPTGEIVRFRQTVKTEKEGVRLEALARAEIERTGRWTGLDPETDAPRRKAGSSRVRRGTLKEALDLAWEHPTKGWKLAEAKSGKLQKANAQQAIDFLGPDTLCNEVTHLDYDRAAKHFAKLNNSNGTITHKLQALHRVLWFAQRAGFIKGRPEWDRPTPGRPRQFIFDPKLEPLVVAYFNGVEARPDMADIFTLGIETGARLGELLALETSDIDELARFLTIRGTDGEGTKNGDDVRVVILSDAALGVLKRRKAEVVRGKLFPRLTGHRVSELMRVCRDELGYEGNGEFTFHCTRHTCGTRMAERGVPLLTMMEQLGHKTAAMTQRYVKLSPAARRATILASLGQSHLAEVAAS